MWGVRISPSLLVIVFPTLLAYRAFCLPGLVNFTTVPCARFPCASGRTIKPTGRVDSREASRREPQNLGSREKTVILSSSECQTKDQQRLENRQVGIETEPGRSGYTRYLEFGQVSKIYRTPDGRGIVKVVDGFDLMIKKGEFFQYGPSRGRSRRQ